jgi:hypothetical protein
MSKWVNPGTIMTPLFDYPLTETAIKQLVGRMNLKENVQAIAANLANNLIWVADFQGLISDAYIVAESIPNTSETLTFDIQKLSAGVGGSTASILSATFALTLSTFKTDQISIFSLINNWSFNPGDVFFVARTGYSAGSGAQIGYNKLVIEPSIGRWK